MSINIQQLLTTKNDQKITIYERHHRSHHPFGLQIGEIINHCGKRDETEVGRRRPIPPTKKIQFSKINTVQK